MQVCKTVKLRMRDRRNGTKSLFLDFWPGYDVWCDAELAERVRYRKAYHLPLFPSYVCLVAARTWYRHIYRSASAQP